MSGPPDVDYSATSLRPEWDALPAALRQELAAALGTEIVAAGRSVGGGFTGGFAAPVRLADGRRVFVKAAEDSQHPYRAYQREAELVPQLPASIPIPPIVATAHAEADGRRWFGVVSAWIDGRMPGAPWTPDDFATATAMCEVIADAMTPSPIPGLTHFAEDLLQRASVLDIPRQILDGELPMPTGFQPWLQRALADLVELMDVAPEAFAGDTATHGDLRPDNLIVDAAGTFWTVDWNWLSLGPRWMDWVGLLPYARYHGIDTATAVRNNPLTADVPAEHLDAFAAVLVAYFLNKLDDPPPAGCTPEIRRHQRLMGWVFLDWLGERRGW